MISAKSLTLIRAACSVTAGSAAISLGHETRAMTAASNSALTVSIEDAPSSSRIRFLGDAKIRRPSSGDGVPPMERSGEMNTSDPDSLAEELPGAVPTVKNSVYFWALVFKNLTNGLTYPRRSSSVDGEEAIHDAAEKKHSFYPKEKELNNKLVGFCRHFVSSPSLKDTTLKTVTASRHLFFVRHGQYFSNRKSERERCLTNVGREQLALTGKRLKEIGTSYSKIVASTMKRAQESAEIIRKCIGRTDLPFDSDPLLEEGAPIVPEPPLRNWRPTQRQFQTDGERIEAAFLKYFQKADNAATHDSHEIIVCHANVIRYFVCRALEVPPEAWLRMWLNHGSITWLTIRPSGRVILNAMGASGYMPPSRLTSS